MSAQDTCECCGETECAGMCEECGSWMCAGEPHDEQCCATGLSRFDREEMAQELREEWGADR